MTSCAFNALDPGVIFMAEYYIVCVIQGEGDVAFLTAPKATSGSSMSDGNMPVLCMGGASQLYKVTCGTWCSSFRLLHRRISARYGTCRKSPL